jgi:hypothetical protein
VVVASYALWQRLGASPDFLGSTLRVNDQSCTVIGIAPKGFAGTTAVLGPEAWLPLGMAPGPEIPSLTEDAPALMLVGRLKPGMALSSAQAQASVLDSRLQIGPGEPGRTVVLDRPSRLGLSNSPTNADSAGSVLAIQALGMAAAVLIIACLNLANLMLARGLTRRKEFAVRMALGASRSQVIRRILLESLLLALLGGAAGFWLSSVLGGLIQQHLMSLFRATTFSVALDLTPDLRVLAATILYSLMTVLVFGLVPALRATRLDLQSELKRQAGAGAIDGRREGFFSLRHSLVMGQIALSLVLLFCVGLFLRAVHQLEKQDVGFAVQDRLIGELDYGLASGALLALVVGRVFQGLLGSVKHANPLEMMCSAALLGGAALLACAWPVWRITRIDPLTALRDE